jgi:hypothetical protein
MALATTRREVVDARAAKYAAQATAKGLKVEVEPTEDYSSFYTVDVMITNPSSRALVYITVRATFGARPRVFASRSWGYGKVSSIQVRDIGWAIAALAYVPTTTEGN